VHTTVWILDSTVLLQRHLINFGESGSPVDLRIKLLIDAEVKRRNGGLVLARTVQTRSILESVRELHPSPALDRMLQLIDDVAEYWPLHDSDLTETCFEELRIGIDAGQTVRDEIVWIASYIHEAGRCGTCDQTRPDDCQDPNCHYFRMLAVANPSDPHYLADMESFFHPSDIVKLGMEH
jgi:hypothetical protein